MYFNTENNDALKRLQIDKPVPNQIFGFLSVLYDTNRLYLSIWMQNKTVLKYVKCKEIIQARSLQIELTSVGLPVL